VELLGSLPQLEATTSGLVLIQLSLIFTSILSQLPLLLLTVVLLKLFAILEPLPIAELELEPESSGASPLLPLFQAPNTLQFTLLPPALLLFVVNSELVLNLTLLDGLALLIQLSSMLVWVIWDLLELQEELVLVLSTILRPMLPSALPALTLALVPTLLTFTAPLLMELPSPPILAISG
jgi:hypothetical protein